MGIFKPDDLLFLAPGVIVAIVMNAVLWLPGRFLLGLRSYAVLDAAARAPFGGARGARKYAPKAGAAAAADVDLGGAETLFIVPLGLLELRASPGFSTLESTWLVATVAALPAAFYFAGRALLGWPDNALPLALAGVAAGAAAHGLLAVDLLARSAARAERVYAAAFGGAAFVAALAVLPSRHAAWDLSRAARATGPLVAAAVRRGGGRAAAALGGAALAAPAVPPGALAAALAALAGALTAALFVPATRVARGLWLAGHPPAWAADQVALPLGRRAALGAQFAAYLACAALWVRPLLWDDVPAGGGAVRPVAAQAAAALGAAALTVANFSALAQLYLHTSLLAWHHLKHGPATATKKGRETAAALVRAKLFVVRRNLGKAAVQLLAPAAVLGGPGLALAYSAAHPGLGAAAGADGNALVEAVAGFVAAWAGGSMFLVSAAVLWLFRQGFLSLERV